MICSGLANVLSGVALICGPRRDRSSGRIIPRSTRATTGCRSERSSEYRRATAFSRRHRFRWPGERPESVRLALHRHDFAQVWYILEGTFTIGGKIYEPGTMIYHADPHYEEDLSTETGGVMLFVQYQGPTTSGRPIYDGRFNVAVRKPVSEERLDI